MNSVCDQERKANVHSAVNRRGRGEKKRGKRQMGGSVASQKEKMETGRATEKERRKKKKQSKEICFGQGIGRRLLKYSGRRIQRLKGAKENLEEIIRKQRWEGG